MGKRLRYLAAGIAGVLCLLLLVFAARLLFIELQLHLGHPFYVDLQYLSKGMFLFTPGFIGILIVWLVVRSARTSVLWLIVPLGIGFMGLQVPPSNYEFSAASVGRSAVATQMSEVGRTLLEWGRKNGHFPASESQFLHMVQQLKQQPSLYAREGQRLPYRMIYIPNAAGPHLPQPPGPEPTMIYCAVSPNLQQFWLTATVLDEVVSTLVSMLKESNGSVQVLHGNL